MTSTQLQESLSQKTGMTHSEMTQFVRNHFEEFVNRKNLNIGTVNFAPNSSTTARMFLPACRRARLAPCNMSAAHTRSFPISMSRFST